MSWEVEETQIEESPGRVVITAGTGGKGGPSRAASPVTTSAPATPDETAAAAATASPDSFRGHEFTIDGTEIDVRLSLTGMEPVFYFNRGIPVPMPGSQNFLIGFEEFLEGSGTLRIGEEEHRVDARLVNERTFFDGNKWGWFEQDWITVQGRELDVFLFKVRYQDDRLPEDIDIGVYCEGVVYLRDQRRMIYFPKVDVVHTRYSEEVVDPVHGRVPVAIEATAEHADVKLNLSFRLIARSGMELAMRTHGIVTVGPKRYELLSELPWNEYIRSSPPPKRRGGGTGP